jgi:hypothetical protein
MYMMADQPSAFQVYQAHMEIQTFEEDCRNRMGVSTIPRRSSRLLVMPSLENSANASEYASTQLMKFGRVVTV